ncbi:MAG TPA: RdgB/HAM1 family non-canonical purine NTP pyrophosphatase [Opitutaceae bacterium]|jgi:XTP/dITP diphosphohydrolase|nr:RdgB/HAM1 family non-canonical purine NTP pyrophosphatase [Opitutaceae bacterium]
MKLFLASGNLHKARELQALADAEGLRVEIVSASTAGGMPAVAEDMGTFAGNAGKKARALRARLPPEAWALADDSGLCVDELGGAPGVESAYYAGLQSDDAANLKKLVEVMSDVPEGRRGAQFVCVLFLVGPAGEFIFEGHCEGGLRREPGGGGGFGYDPIFVPAGYDRSFAELGDEIKNRLSHRARAWTKLADWLRSRT